MSGGFSIGGLITGLDSNTIIQQLVQLERLPTARLQNQIGALRTEQTAVRDLRVQLQTLRSRSQDFQFGGIFDQFEATSSDESVVEAAIGEGTPTEGAFTIDVLQLASATQAYGGAPLGGAVNPAAVLDSAGFGTDVTAGTFTINGESFTIDPSAESLNDTLSTINSSGAGVIATYDGATDTVTIENSTPGDTSIINFGATGDDSNFLVALNVEEATQVTGATGATEVESTRNLGSIDPNAVLNTVSFAGGAVTAGSFKINGVSINVDPTTDSIQSVLQAINGSDAQVQASYDSATDTIRVVSDTLGSRTISFTSGTSNFLDVTNLTAAVQTAGSDSEFTINGGATQIRNANEISNAIGGVTLSFSSLGTSIVNVSHDDDSIVENVQGFVDAFNDAVTNIRELVDRDGVLENQTSIRIIENSLRNEIFQSVGGPIGLFGSLLEVGITTGDNFNSAGTALLEIDEETFRSSLLDNRDAVAELFSNTGDTGIGDAIDNYLENIVSTNGFLNSRARGGGSIDDAIESLENRIERINLRVDSFEQRLRAKFVRLEQMSAQFQQSGASLAGLSSGFGGI
jgi:flagellar hook-associated protein 2